MHIIIYIVQIILVITLCYGRIAMGLQRLSKDRFGYDELSPEAKKYERKRFLLFSTLIIVIICIALFIIENKSIAAVQYYIK